MIDIAVERHFKCKKSTVNSEHNMMRQCVLLALLVAVCAAHPGLFGKDDVLRFSPQNQDGGFDKEWADYKETYGRKYDTEEEEEIARKAIFAENYKRITEHNALASKGLKSFTMAINKNSDKTYEERVKTRKGYQHPEQTIEMGGDSGIDYVSPAMPVSLPDEVDWRKHGYVNEVMDEGRCAADYAFAANGAVEGQHKRKTGKLVKLSEQQIVECSKNFGNGGCNYGGYTNYTFEYMSRSHGIDTNESYPYIPYEEWACRFNQSTVAATVTGYVKLPFAREDKLKEAVATIGPIAVEMSSHPFSFDDYHSGIYDDDKCHETQAFYQESMLVVGYGTQNGTDYWLVRNNRGKDWGMNGYIMVIRGKDMCDIAHYARYPLV